MQHLEDERQYLFHVFLLEGFFGFGVRFPGHAQGGSSRVGRELVEEIGEDRAADDLHRFVGMLQEMRHLFEQLASIGVKASGIFVEGAALQNHGYRRQNLFSDVRLCRRRKRKSWR